VVLARNDDDDDIMLVLFIFSAVQYCIKLLTPWVRSVNTRRMTV